MKEKGHKQSKEEYVDHFRSPSLKPPMIKVTRRQHRSQNIQKKIQHNTIIHITIRPQTKNIPSSQYNSFQKAPANSTKHEHHQNIPKRSPILETVRPTNVSSLHSSQNSWYNDDSEENLTKTNIISSVNFNSGVSNDVKTKNGWPDWTTLENEHQPNAKKKKKTKCLRVSVITSIIVAIILAIVITVTLVMLLNKSKTTTINRTAVLRWNTTGITVAGVTSQQGVASNKLNLPVGLAIDYANSLYIADYVNNRIQKYETGALLGQTVAGQANGTGSNSSACLLHPTDVTVDTNSNVYALDSANNRVQFWSNGSLLGITLAGNSSSANLNDQLSSPYGIARDPDSSTLYISDTLHNRVMRYLSGTMSGTIGIGTGLPGLNSTQLSAPYAINLDLPTNSLLIANAGLHSIVRWSLSGSTWTLVAGNNGVSGSSSTALNTPVDATVDPMGNIYVTDTYNHRIQFFTADQSNGITIAGVNRTQGANATLLNTPFSVALDSQLNLYVSDSYNHRVQKFLRY